MKKWTLIFLMVIFSLLVSSCETVFYAPGPYYYYPPENFGYDPQHVFFPSLDGTKLSGWIFPSKITAEKDLIILQFHGNGENMTSHYLSLAWTTKKGFELITFDYRGYGKSEGELGHKGVIEDAISAYNFAKKRALAANKKLVLFAQSLGATILLKAIENFDDTGVIHSVFIDGGFIHHTAIANDLLSRFWLTWPFQWLPYLVVSNSYSPNRFYEYFPQDVPLIVIHGEKDQVVPIRFGKEIYALAKPPKRWILARNMHHIESMHHPEYRELFLEITKQQSEINRHVDPD
jgi:fermentation-respiration switch protein FrsA (DUF1100 family)